MDPNTGEIRVSGDLTRDTDVVYNLVVTARDSGTPPQTATSTVIVNVINAGQPLAPLIEAETPPVQFALPQYQYVEKLNFTSIFQYISSNIFLIYFSKNLPKNVHQIN